MTDSPRKALRASTDGGAAPAPIAPSADFSIGGPRALYVLVVCSLLSAVRYADWQVLSVVIEPLKADLGLDDLQIGLVNTAFFVGIVLFSMPLAHLVDTWSRRKVIAWVAIVWSLFTLFTGLAGGLATTERDVRVARAKEAAAELLGDWPAPDRTFFLGLGYPAYWLSFDPETHARHARLIRDAEARGAPLTVDTQPLPARAVTEVTVYTADHAGLFSRIAGALAVAGASIVDARIHTLTNGSALDTFWIQDAAGGTLDAPHRLARLHALVEQALSGRLGLEGEMRRASANLVGRRMRAIHVPPRVVIDNRASNTHTVLEVNGRDRPGLLHDVTAAISDQGMQIASAHVTTYGVRAVDVFYVKDVFGLKVENDRKLAALRAALLAALGSPDEPVVTDPVAVTVSVPTVELVHPALPEGQTITVTEASAAL